MGRKRHTSKAIASKLRQADVLTAHGHPVVDAIRTISVTEVSRVTNCGCHLANKKTGSANANAKLTFKPNHLVGNCQSSICCTSLATSASARATIPQHMHEARKAPFFMLVWEPFGKSWMKGSRTPSTLIATNRCPLGGFRRSKSRRSPLTFRW